MINNLSRDLNYKEQIHNLLDLFIQLQDTQDLNTLCTYWRFYWIALSASKNQNPEIHLKLEQGNLSK